MREGGGSKWETEGEGASFYYSDYGTSTWIEILLQLKKSKRKSVFRRGLGFRWADSETNTQV